MKTRCKMQCMKVVQNAYNGNDFEFHPVYSDDENSENKKFWEATPSGKLEFQCLNPDVKFEAGKEYYIDISEASTTN